MTETVRWVLGTGESVEVTRQELGYVISYARLWTGVLETLVDGGVEMPELVLKLMQMGALMDHAAPDVIPAIMGVMNRVNGGGETELNIHNRKAAAVVEDFIRPISDKQWEKSKTTFAEKAEREERINDLEERLFGKQDRREDLNRSDLDTAPSPEAQDDPVLRT